jgi:hypothetical protein
MISRLRSVARIVLSIVVVAAVALAGQAGQRWMP